MDAHTEMHDLERLWRESPHGNEFLLLRRTSKWGERIRQEVIQGIERGDPGAIEDGILFLEVNPWYFRSGYFKGRIASKLKSVALTSEQRERLRKVILSATESRVGPEFNEYARLAVVVASPDFISQLIDRRGSSHGWVRGRLTRILVLCGKCRPTCPKCDESMPSKPKPTTVRQRIWGGWTCTKCGCQMDKYGVEVADESDE